MNLSSQAVNYASFSTEITNQVATALLAALHSACHCLLVPVPAMLLEHIN